MEPTPIEATPIEPLPDVAILGPSVWNTMVVLDQLPSPVPHMEVARDSWDALGATSAGKALHLADLGRSARLYTTLADDEPGRRIRTALAGVDVHPLPTKRSERHINLMTPEGARLSIYATPPATTAQPPRPESLASARAVVLDLAPWTRELANALRPGQLPVWCDLHDVPDDPDWHRPFLAAATYLQCSADRLTSPLEFLRARVAQGARLAICTLGAEGAIAVDAHGDHRIAAVPCPVVDTNGAGDAFFAGVLHAVLDGADTQHALAAGARQACRALETRELGPLPA